MIEAQPLTDREAADLQKRRRLTPTERARLQRHRIAAAWGLGTTAPTPELLEADRDRLDRRIRFGWLVRSSDARQLVARADLAKAKAMAPDGVSWSPDLCRELEGPRLAAADALGLPAWLERAERAEWFTADDAQLLQLQATATAHSASMAQSLGLTPGKRATTTLRQLLALAGYRLESERRRSGGSRLAAAGYRYRVVREALPSGADPFALVAAWERELQGLAAGCVPKSAIH